MLKRVLLSIGAMLVLTIPASAQLPVFDRFENTAAEMLSFVPDAPEVRETFLSYINYAALQATGPYGVIDPESAAAFDDLDDFEQGLWMHRTNRWNMGPDIRVTIGGAMRGEEPARGFDMFALNQAVSFSRPPFQGVVYAADYEPDTFAAAQVERNYEQTTIAGLEAWCLVSGCDEGDRTDFENRSINDVFDPSGLGRQPPIVVTEDYLVSAFDLGMITAAANAYTGEGRSIMDVQDYSTVFAAVTDGERYNGDLLQLMYLPVEPQMSGAEVIAQINLFNEGEERERLESWATYGELPPYLMVAIADRQEGDEQVAMLALLYDNVGDAETAAVELEARLSVYANEIVFRRTDPLLDEVPSAVLSTHVFEGDDGLYVAVAEVRHELPPETPEMIEVRLNDDLDYEGPRFQGFFIRQWINAVYQRSLDVLWAVE